MGTVERAVTAMMASHPQSPPPGLDWDLFLGPAQEVPYHPAYHPFSWRGWVDFGGGALGDMGAHLVDQAYWALELTQPTAITTSSSPWGGAADNPATFPLAVTAEYEYPARGSAPALKLFWYDGGLMPPRPPFLPDEVALPRGDGGGGVFVGERGILTYETYGNRPTVYPASVAAEAEAVPQSIARVTTGHEANWAAACKGEAEVSCPFSYAAPLTESMLLGMAALRAGAGKKVLYDSANMRFTNDEKANAALTREYRAGWRI
jgi:predicted dehydrogenase